MATHYAFDIYEMQTFSFAIKKYNQSGNLDFALNRIVHSHLFIYLIYYLENLI